MTTFRPHWPGLVAIPTRVGQGLAVTALMAGLAIGASGVANAEWDVIKYDKCRDALDTLYSEGQLTDKQFDEGKAKCCTDSGGVISESSTHVCRSSSVPRTTRTGSPSAPTAASQPPAPAKPVAPVAARPTGMGPGRQP